MRTVNIALVPQQEYELVFKPDSASLGDDTFLVRSEYRVTTNTSGIGSINLPVPGVSGSLRYDYEILNTDVSGVFYLGNGGAINLEDLISLGVLATPTLIDYIDAQIAGGGGGGGGGVWGSITGTLSNQTDLQNALNAKAALASPSLTGTPTAPTAAPGTNTTQIATTGFVQTAGAAFQPLDTDLTAIAALVSAANKMPYATGAGTWALADLTVAGRALIDDADATAQRATLGLVIGTNVQAFNANLADIAALVDPNADQLVFWDDSAGHLVYLTLGTNLSITGTTINASGGGGGITNSAGANVIPKSNGTNIVASAFSNATGDIMTGSGSTSLELSNANGAILSFDGSNKIFAGNNAIKFTCNGGDLNFKWDGSAFNEVWASTLVHLGQVGNPFGNLYQSKFHEMAEMTAPSAPAADHVRIYAVDNGAGKTQLMALFSSGSAQQIAIQP